MCGIGGVVGMTCDRLMLRRIAGALAHRGPDAEGVWAGELVGLAHRRLAVIDLDPRSDQPMHLGRWHLVFNGEIYNYRELRDELSAGGREFRTAGDTEVLLHAWDAWGEGALDRLNGMFAFALWDARERALTLAVDPFGEKPLAYALRGRALAFASEARALAAAGLRLRTDDIALARYVALGEMPASSATFFEDVQRLPGGHVARWTDGRLSARRYWWPRRRSVPRDRAAAAAQLRQLLEDAVALRLRSDVPVGTSLSGGLDSSTILCVAGQAAGDHRRHAFTARFPGFERDEWRHAQLAAQRAGVLWHHAVEPTSETLWVDLPTFIRDIEEPVRSLSAYAQWAVMRAASRAGVVVLLDGQGADELFGGYDGLAGVAARSYRPPASLRALLSAGGPRAQWLRAVAVAHAPERVRAQERLRRASPYAAPDLRVLAARQPPLQVSGVALDGRPLRRELLRQAFATSLPELLRYADRHSMAHGREVRLPFLDRRVAEFALSAPAELLHWGGQRKQLLRDAARGIVPDPIIERRDKIGFEPPQARWLTAGRARSWIADVLLDPSARTRGLYDSAALAADLRAGAWRDHDALWRALNAELWLGSSAVAEGLAA